MKPLIHDCHKKQLAAWLLFFMPFIFVSAQKARTTTHIIWYGYTQSLKINPHWILINEVDDRRFLGPLKSFQTLYRGQMVYNHDELWNAGAGLGVLWQKGVSPEDTIALRVPEIRPHIEFGIRQKIKRLTLEHRYRAEARFFHHTNPELHTLEDGYGLGSFRLRYRLQLVLPLLKYGADKSLKLKLYDEVFINAGKDILYNTFDQNRIYGGLNANLVKGISLEAGFFRMLQQNRSGTSYQVRNNLRFTLLHTLTLHKTKTTH